MPFSFLNPWFWLGAVAVGAPIWLHLRRKKETNLVKFSALRFLDDQPQPRHSPWRLQDLGMFVLRVLALMLVVAAFAWPYRPEANPMIVKESRVYLLDNTLSHQAANGFTRDRDRVAQEISRLGGDIQVAVVELTARSRVVVAFSDDRPTAQQRLRALSPSFQRGSFLSAFRQANALLAHSFGERKRILFCSDNQENQWAENIDSPPFLREVTIDLPKVIAAQAPNLSLAEPRAQRIFLGDQSLVNWTVKLVHQGEAKSATITLRANDQVILNRPTPLENQPETMLLQAQWPADPTQWLQGEAVVEGGPEVLTGDNRVFFSLPPVREGRVDLLAQSPYLRLALSPEIMRGYWANRVLEPGRLADEQPAKSEADVLCLESSYLASPDARKWMFRYLNQGRGVLLFVNRLSLVINDTLRELGFELLSPGESAGAKAESFQYVFSSHPVFHPFLASDFGNLMEVKIRKHVRLKAIQGMPLIFAESGDPVFFQGTKWPGKLFVAAFGLGRDQASWALHPTFIPFLDLCLQNARPEDATQPDHEPGEVVMVHLPAGSPVHEVVLRDGARELHRATVAQGQARLPMPVQPGLYSVTYDSAAAVEKVLSVNPSPKESRLTYVESPEAIRAWQLPRSDRPAKPIHIATPASMTRAAILQQHIGWWLLLGGLIALVGETLWVTMKERV